MAVKLIANYAKRLGLPAYSSHQFSVSIETELQNLDNVRKESALRLMAMAWRRTRTGSRSENKVVAKL